MRNAFLVIFCCLLLSCGADKEEEIYQGKLEELIVGDFTFYKDSLTSIVSRVRTLEEGNREFLVTTTNARNTKGRAIVFSSPESGKEINRVEIPREGPESLKGGILIDHVVRQGEILVVSRFGEIGFYNMHGELDRTIPFEILDEEPEIVYNLSGNGINLRGDWLQISKNVNFITNYKDVPGPGEMKSEFDVNFREWILHVNLQTGEIKKSNFSIPTDYEVFKNDLTSTSFFGAWDSKRENYYLCWPGSPEIYTLNGVELKGKLVPKTRQEFNYLPSETIPWGDKFSVWALPKEASRNVFLLFDKHRDLILKCSKINESGVGETKFERTKHYVLSIYSGDWEPKGEYLFDFESELDLENWFLTSEGLFINKPEQASEDEYEFYKIDLSRFVD